MPAVSAESRAATPSSGKQTPAVADRAQRTHLARAYRAARAAPHDPERRVALAERLLQVGRPGYAQRHALRAASLAHPGWPGAVGLGELLFELGAFDAALDVLIPALRRGTRDAAALCTLSALLHRRGDREGARGALFAATRLRPVTPPRRHDPNKPTVLRLRSVQNSFYGIVHDKASDRYRRRLKEGHFSIKNLLNKARINLYVASILGDNLQACDAVPAPNLIINAVSCADLNPGALREIDTFLEDFPGVPVINPPRRVLDTTRAGNSQRLSGLAGVRFPRTELFVNDAPPDQVARRLEAAGFGYPLIVRLPGTQTGDSMSREDSRTGLMDRLADTPPGQALYAIEYVDCRDRQGLYHKTRAFFIDGVFYPVANLTSDTWQIHSGDRYRVMSKSTSTRRAEMRYLRDAEAYLGADAFRALHRVAAAIRLDFFGVDFTIGRDGRLVVFEANAAMRHNFDHAGAFPYTRPHLERISGAFDAMVHRRMLKAPVARSRPLDAGQPETA